MTTPAIASMEPPSLEAPLNAVLMETGEVPAVELDPETDSTAGCVVAAEVATVLNDSDVIDSVKVMTVVDSTASPLEPVVEWTDV